MSETVSFGYEDIDATEKTGRVGEVFPTSPPNTTS